MITEISFYKDIKNLENLKFFTILTESILQSQAESIANVIASRETFENKKVFSNLIYSIVKSTQNSTEHPCSKYLFDFTQDIVLFDCRGNKYHLVVINKLYQAE